MKLLKVTDNKFKIKLMFLKLCKHFTAHFSRIISKDFINYFLTFCYCLTQNEK